MLPLLTLLLLAISTQASTLSLQSPRFVISDSIGTQLRSEPISLAQKVATPVNVATSEILKLTFQVVDADGNGVQPHQAFLRFYDEKSDEEGIQPLRVNTNGKTKFELNLAKPPLSLPPTTSEPLKVSLYIGSPSHSPLQVELFDLVLPPSHPAPVHPEEEFFHSRPEIKHTFRPEQKVPPKPISAAFSLFVLASWVVLLGLWATVAPRASYLFSPSILSFIITLGAFEGLLLWYWIELKLGQVLLYGGILGVITIFAGKQALVGIGKRRVGRK